MSNRIDSFTVGERVQLHPATDLWMRGARYGSVVKIGRLLVSVRLDATDRTVNMHPDNLLHSGE